MLQNGSCKEKKSHLKKQWHSVKLYYLPGTIKKPSLLGKKENVLCVAHVSHINDIIINPWLYTSQMESKYSKVKQEMKSQVCYQKPCKKAALPAVWIICNSWPEWRMCVSGVAYYASQSRMDLRSTVLPTEVSARIGCWWVGSLRYKVEGLTILNIWNL